MFGFSKNRSGGQVVRRANGALATAARGVIEQLEGRMLLSAAPSGFLQGLVAHTLTSEELGSHDLVVRQWQGREIYARQNEWILSLQTPAPTLSPSGTVIDLNIEWASPSVRSPELQAAFDELKLGIQFDHYLGVKNTVLIQVPESVSSQEMAKALSKLPGFVAVEPNTLGAVDTTLPNDPLFSSEYGLNNTGQTGGTSDADIDAPQAWDISTGSSGMVVGVIDTGVDYNHPDLAGNMWTNPGEIAGNGLDDDANGYPDDVHGYDFVGANDSNPMDDVGHGTHVAGTVAAIGNNGVGVTGVAWDASIMAIKWIAANGSGTTSDAIEAVNYATLMRNRGVNIRITNNSWHTVEGYNLALKNAIQSSGTAGMLFIAAAGNGGIDNDTDPNANYPATFGLDNIISVAASDDTDSLAFFSSYGDVTVDLAAPGVDIRSTVPTVGDPTIVDPSGYNYLNGTSMASPHVAGVAALAFSVNPNATYQQVRDAIFNGVDAKSSLTGKVATGGRLNAFNTLQLMSPPSLTVNGDLNGSPTADTILVRKDPVSPTFLQVLVNGVERGRKLYASLSTVAVNGMGLGDTITVDPGVSIPVIVTGGSGSDSITGGSGNDTLTGGNQSDTLNGGNGNDLLDGSSSADVMSGGAGIDKVDYSNRINGVRVSLDTLNNATDGETGEADNVMNDIEDISGGGGNDSLFGSNLDNEIGGGSGNDSIFGDLGNDELFGGKGADTVNGSGGNDIVDGGLGANYLTGEDGNDTLFSINSIIDSLLDGGIGTDTLHGDASDVYSNIELFLTT